jgi:hypothetical protein
MDPALRLSQTDEVIRFWREHGVLIVPHPFAEAVGSLPQNQRKRWQAAVAFAFNRRQLFGPLASLVKQVQLSLVCPDWFVGKGLKDIASVEDEELGCEACRIDCLNLSEVVKGLWESRAGEFPERTPCDEIWTSCFSRLIQHAGTITVMDRYAGRDLLTCKGERRSGFLGLLDRLPQKSHERHLKLYTGVGKEGNGYGTESDVIAAVKAAVDHLLPIGYTFTLYLAEDCNFGARYHYRYFRFDQSWSLKTDAGLAILEGPDLWRRATYSFESVSDEHLQAETRFTSEFSTKALEIRKSGACAA